MGLPLSKYPRKKSKIRPFDIFLKLGVYVLGKMGLKWVAVARIGLKLGGNEATRFRIILKPDLYIKKCLVGVSLE